MEGKNWSCFDLDFRVTIYPCAIPFSKPPLHFNSSFLQGGLLIAQAQAQAYTMALTRSTIVANDDIAASIVVDANTGTVIQDSKSNEDAQAQESEINYKLDISDDSVDCGFFSPNTMAGPHAKAGNRQGDSTTTMIGALAIDRAAYL